MTAIVESNEAPFITEAINDGNGRITQYLVITIALILNMLDGFDVTSMAFTVHSIGEDLSIAPDKLGIVFSTALAGMVIGAMFIAPISDRIGRRSMVLGSILAIGLSMLATAFVESLWQLIILRLITGLGVGGMLASLATISAEYTPERYRSFAVVTVTAGYPLGATLGGFVAAPLMAEYGWQSVFVAGGIATLAMTVAVYLLIPESLQFIVVRRPPNALRKVNRILQRLNSPALAALPEIDSGESPPNANVFSLLTNEWRSKTIILWLTFFFCFITLYFLLSWIPKLVVNAGMSVSDGVYASMVLNGGAVIGILSLGWLAEHFGLSRIIAVFLFASGVIMSVFAITNGIDYLLIYLFAIGYLLQGGFVGLYAAAAKLYPAEIRTTGVGWGIGLGRLGAVAGPYFGGVLIAQGVSLESNFIIFSIPMVISGIIAMRLTVK
ncbi:MFS transporter [Kineobactrum salinum]|uniref:MFS transporter n=1 Tax=Kineobactrum salinum TaxID=2708301 RepID=A0A6C0TYW0_9GAMM|nr:MFS transporter [Kineobactrum salinum]QIB64981.1 MFS transporter [Kineobactrum salinum]